MNTSPDHLEVVLRIVLAMVAGMVVGMEREGHGRAAGLRTTTLVSVAAAMAMILSEGFQTGGLGMGNWRPDPARLGAGVLTGIGFLGAGSIIRQEHVIRGVTTAATLWSITIIGLCFGAGYYALGAIGWGVALLALFVLPHLEHHLRPDWYAKLTVVLDVSGPSESDLRQMIVRQGIAIQNVDLVHDVENRRRQVSYGLKLKRNDLMTKSNECVTLLSGQAGVKHITWE